MSKEDDDRISNDDKDQFRSDKGHLMMSPSAVVFGLSDVHRRRAANCLHENGEIRISFKEISVTNLREIRELNGDGGVIVD